MSSKIVLGASVFAAIGAAYLYNTIPAPAAGDRLAVIPEGSVEIDNVFYDTEAWSDLWFHPDQPLLLYNNARAPFFLGRLKELPSGSKVLDVACGAGLLTEAVARELPDLKFTGIDLSPRTIRAAAKHASQHGVSNVEYKTASAYDLPFEVGHFDAVISSDAAEHMHDLNRYMSEISRVLKPNGVFVFDTINRTWMSFLGLYWIAQRILVLLPPDTHHYSLFVTPDEMTQSADAHGLTTASKSEIIGMRPTVQPLNFLRVFASAGFDRMRKEPSLRWSFLGPFTTTSDTSQAYGWYAIKESAKSA